MRQTPDAFLLSVSIVSYRSDQDWLVETIRSLGVAARLLEVAPGGGSTSLLLVENGPDEQLRSLLADPQMRETFAVFGKTVVLSGHGNVGYGRGHNLAIEAADSVYHLILNPDVRISGDALPAAIGFLGAHRDVGLLAPRVDDENGRLQYLCRRYPNVVDLILRGFLPLSMQSVFDRRLARYEMRREVRDAIERDAVLADPPLVSGCFMLFRTEILRRLNGFDPAYFLYFEDYDLSVRARALTHVAYVPTVQIVHYGGGAARKGLRHIGMFLSSARRFFHKHGWRFW